MSYRKALESAGAEIIAWGDFGSCEGDWWAKVRHNGHAKWVNGFCGSCPATDSFQNEFNGVDDSSEEYQKRLADFGRTYLDGWLTQEEAESIAGKDISWDTDAVEMLQFIKDNK